MIICDICKKSDGKIYHANLVFHEDDKSSHANGQQIGRTLKLDICMDCVNHFSEILGKMNR